MSAHHSYGVDVSSLHIRSQGATKKRTKGAKSDGFADSAGLTCTVPAGSITGLFGLNGVGKTTLLEAMSGRIPFASGHLTYTEAPVGSSLDDLTPMLVGNPDEVPHENVGSVPKYHRALRPRWDQDLFDSLVEAFSIPTDTSFEKMSRGQKSLTMAALGLASGEGFIAFDEVTSGVDQEARANLLDVLLHRHGRDNATYMLSSHLVEELDGVIDHVIVMTKGEVVYCGSPDDLREQFITFHSSAEDVQKLLRENLSTEELAAARFIDSEDAGIVVRLPDSDSRQRMETAAQDANIHHEWPSLAQVSVYATEGHQPCGAKS